MHAKKIQFFILLIFSFVFAGQEALAGAAAHFVGAYRIQVPVTNGDQYLIVDNGTLLEIWTKYADSPLPSDLEQYKNEQTILAGFTHREFIILALEAFSTIMERYLRIQGGENDLLEMYRRDDLNYDMGTRQAGQVDRYQLAPPLPLGSLLRIDGKQLIFHKF